MGRRAREPVRRSGENLWRPSLGSRVLTATLALLLGVGYVWSLSEGLTLGKHLYYGALATFGAVTVPVVLFRWRLVLEPDELIRVFLRVRRVPIRDIVAAKVVPREGFVFVCADGSELSFGALGNSPWSYRRAEPTRADLVARAVLCAAARQRGEEPPLDFRLPPPTGFVRAAIEVGIWAAVIGLVTGGD